MNRGAWHLIMAMSARLGHCNSWRGLAAIFWQFIGIKGFYTEGKDFPFLPGPFLYPIDE